MPGDQASAKGLYMPCFSESCAFIKVIFPLITSSLQILPPNPAPSVFLFAVCLSVQVEKPSLQSSKAKKTSVSHKPPRKAKDKQGASGRASKKKSAEGARTAPPTADKEQSAEMNNKLAEAKE